MAQANKTRYIEFRIADLNGVSVGNRDLSALQVTLYRDAQACTDVVTLTNWDNAGLYYASYKPTAKGHDYLEIYDPLYDLRFIDAEDISPATDGSSPDSDISQVIGLTQDYGAEGRFKIEDRNPSRFNVLVYKSFDWQSGRTNPSYSIAGTSIDDLGNWTAPMLTVLPDTYHVVAVDSTSGENRVLAAFMKVELSF